MAIKYAVSQLVPFTSYNELMVNPDTYSFDISKIENSDAHLQEKLQQLLNYYIEEYYGLDCEASVRVHDDEEYRQFFFHIRKSNAQLWHFIAVRDGKFYQKSSCELQINRVVSQCHCENRGAIRESRLPEELLKDVEAADGQLMEQFQVSISRACSLIQ